MAITFDGSNKLIVVTDAGALVNVAAKEIYSRWKDWVLAGNAQFDPAFRTIGGDPLGGSVAAGDYYFLNNEAGWRIRPKEEDHELVISGNLYGENPLLPVFSSTIGNYQVLVQRSLSSLTQTVSVGSGLSPTESTRLEELHKIHGLDATAPLVVDQDSRSAGSISQTITKGPGPIGEEPITITRD